MIKKRQEIIDWEDDNGVQVVIVACLVPLLQQLSKGIIGEISIVRRPELWRVDGCVRPEEIMPSAVLRLNHKHRSNNLPSQGFWTI